MYPHDIVSGNAAARVLVVQVNIRRFAIRRARVVNASANDVTHPAAVPRRDVRMYERDFRGVIIVLVRDVPQKTSGFPSGPRVIHARAKLLIPRLHVQPFL